MKGYKLEIEIEKNDWSNDTGRMVKLQLNCSK